MRDYPLTNRTRFILASVVSLFFFSLGLALGQWQLSRAAQKEAWSDARSAAFSLAPLQNSDLSSLQADSSISYRRVQMQGRWLNAKTMFLDNRTMAGKVGLIMVTPFELAPQNRVILVQRGWVARNFLDRSALPDINSQQGLLEISGQIRPWPSRHYAIGGPETGLIRQNLGPEDYGDLAGLLHQTYSVQQSGPSPEGLLREWVQPGAGADTHYGYAFQWFTLSGLVAIYYLWFQIVKRYRRPKA